MKKETIRTLEQEIEQKLQYIIEHPDDTEYNAELKDNILDLRKGIIILKAFNLEELSKNLPKKNVIIVDNEVKDTSPKTYEHKRKVHEFINKIIKKLLNRAESHDDSKLSDKEKPYFDKHEHALKGLSYGTKEYFDNLEKLKPALDNHYKTNSHHPEHYQNGIKGMSLIDIVEMFCDWNSAVLRHKDGDIYKSIEFNQKRYDYSDDLKQIFINTVKEINKGE